MLQSKIKRRADVAINAAIADAASEGWLDELHAQRAAAKVAREGSVGRERAEANISELLGLIASPASRAGFSAMAIVEIAAAERAGKRAGGRADFFTDRYVMANRAEAEAQRAVTVAQRALDQAKRDRRAAEADYEAYGVADMLRDDR